MESQEIKSIIPLLYEQAKFFLVESTFSNFKIQFFNLQPDDTFDDLIIYYQTKQLIQSDFKLYIDNILVPTINYSKLILQFCIENEIIIPKSFQPSNNIIKIKFSDKKSIMEPKVQPQIQKFWDLIDKSFTDDSFEVSQISQELIDIISSIIELNPKPKIETISTIFLTKLINLIIIIEFSNDIVLAQNLIFFIVYLDIEVPSTEYFINICNCSLREETEPKKICFYIVYLSKNQKLFEAHENIFQISFLNHLGASVESDKNLTIQAIESICNLMIKPIYFIPFFFSNLTDLVIFHRGELPNNICLKLCNVYLLALKHFKYYKRSTQLYNILLNSPFNCFLKDL